MAIDPLCGKATALVHEFRQVFMDDALALLKRVVAREDELRVIVADFLQRCVLSVFGGLVGRDCHRHLGVGVVGIPASEDEIAFERADSADADGMAVGPGIDIDDVLECRAVVDPVVCVGGKIEPEVGQVELLLAADRSS